VTTVPFEMKLVLIKTHVVIVLLIDAGWLLRVRRIGELTTLPLPS
jgi:hypothetical protein